MFFKTLLTRNVLNSNLNRKLNKLMNSYECFCSSSGSQILEDKSIFPDFKNGPLQHYRDKSSFCYKRMNILLEGEDHIRLKVNVMSGKKWHIKIKVH